MITFKFEKHGQVFVHTEHSEDPWICGRALREFGVPESAKDIWIEVRLRPKAGYMKFECEQYECGDLCNRKVDGKHYITAYKLDELIINHGLHKKPFYFCIWYEESK